VIQRTVLLLLCGDLILQAGSNTAAPLGSKARIIDDLIAWIQDNLDRLSPWEAALLYHSLVKLRLPEEKLIEEVAAKCEEHVFQMPPKGVALVAWA